MMTKRHFVALADTLKTVPKHNVDRRTVVVKHEDMLDAVCAFCRQENPYFDETIFRGYIAGTCGPSGGKIKAK